MSDIVRSTSGGQVGVHPAPAAGASPYTGAGRSVVAQEWSGRPVGFDDVARGVDLAPGEFVAAACEVGKVRRRKGTSEYYRPRTAWRVTRAGADLLRWEQPLTALPDGTFARAADYHLVEHRRFAASGPATRRQGDVRVDAEPSAQAAPVGEATPSSDVRIPGATDRFGGQISYLPLVVRQGFCGAQAEYADTEALAYTNSGAVAPSRYACSAVWIEGPQVRAIRANLHAGAPHWQVEQVALPIGSARAMLGGGR